MSAPATASAGKTGNPVLEYFRAFKILKDNPVEYWGIQAINFVDSAAYFALLTIVTLFLSDDLGFTDENAGYVVTVFTSAVTILLLVAGLITDWLGIRRSLYLSFGAKTLVSLGIGALPFVGEFPGRTIAVFALFLLLAVPNAMVATVFQAANKRYTTQRSRSAGFNLWYLFMNVGAAVAGVLVDAVRVWAGLPTYWLVLLSVVASFASLLVGLAFVRREAQVVGPGEAPEAEVQAGPRKGPVAILREMLRESAFWRFVVLISLLIGVRAVYAYMYLLMPKYWVRVIGPDANIGLLNTINPILIVVGLIVFIPVANRFDIFKMLTFGAMISAASLFVLVIPWRLVSTDVATGYYILAIVSMVLLSVGEVFWSPKLNEYTAAIAPKGQEGSYLGMSMMPWFVAKLVVSAMSGHMLTRYSPEGIGERIREGVVPFWESPEAMWLLLGVWAMSGPVIALFFRGWLTKGARWQADAPAAARAEEPGAAAAG